MGAKALCVQALSVGIFPYVLKLLQSSARELRPLLVFIWAKILAVDSVSGVKPSTREICFQDPPVRNIPKHVGHNTREFSGSTRNGWLRNSECFRRINEIHDVLPLIRSSELGMDLGCSC